MHVSHTGCEQHMYMCVFYIVSLFVYRAYTLIMCSTCMLCWSWWMFLVVLLCFCEFAWSWWLLGTFSQSHSSGSHGSIAVVLLCMCGWFHFYICQCIRSRSNWCHSLSKWMSVPSSHLDSSCPHTASHSNPLSSEVLSTRWFPPEWHHFIWGFLHNHWPCTCHNVQSLSGRTDPTWIWLFLLHTHSYNL